MTRLPALLLPVLMLGTAPQVRGQELAAPSAATLRIDVVAVDQKGAPVTDLEPSEFEVWITGYRVPIADVFALTPSAGSRTVVLLLDDMAADQALAQRVREAARYFVAQLKPGDKLGIVSLNGGVIESTEDRTRLLAAIDAYHVRGFPFRPDDAGQHVLKTIETVSLQLAESSAGRKTIVGIGAGWMFDAPLPPPGVRDLEREWAMTMRAMAATNTSLYVIDPGGIGTARGAGALGGASGFARETGGYAFLNTNDLRGAAERIWAEAGTYYMLAMVNPPVQQSAELRKVDVRVLRKGVTVRARRGIKGRH